MPSTEALPNYTASQTDWSLIPERMRGGIRRYIENGIPPGSFLTAVISNDLRGAYERADDENRLIVENYVRFFYCYAPNTCSGSAALFETWCAHGGLSQRRAA